MALYATCMPLPSDTFHDKLIAYDHGDGADYDHDPRGGAVALYATCVPLSSDTFHDKLFACDQGDDAEYDHDPRGGTVDLYATSMPLPSDTFHHNLWGPRWCVSNLGSSTVLLGLVTGIICFLLKCLKRYICSLIAER